MGKKEEVGSEYGFLVFVLKSFSGYSEVQICNAIFRTVIETRFGSAGNVQSLEKMACGSFCTSSVWTNEKVVPIVVCIYFHP